MAKRIRLCLSLVRQTYLSWNNLLSRFHYLTVLFHCRLYRQKPIRLQKSVRICHQVALGRCICPIHVSFHFPIDQHTLCHYGNVLFHGRLLRRKPIHLRKSVCICHQVSLGRCICPIRVSIHSSINQHIFRHYGTVLFHGHVLYHLAILLLRIPQLCHQVALGRCICPFHVSFHSPINQHTLHHYGTVLFHGLVCHHLAILLRRTVRLCHQVALGRKFCPIRVSFHFPIDLHKHHHHPTVLFHGRVCHHLAILLRRIPQLCHQVALSRCIYPIHVSFHSSIDLHKHRHHPTVLFHGRDSHHLAILLRKSVRKYHQVALGRCICPIHVSFHSPIDPHTQYHHPNVLFHGHVSYHLAILHRRISLLCHQVALGK